MNETLTRVGGIRSACVIAHRARELIPNGTSRQVAHIRIDASPRPKLGRFARLIFGQSPQADALRAGPLRGELLGVDQLAESARALARGQTLTPTGKTKLRPPLLARLKATTRILRLSHARLSAGAGKDLEIGPAGVWLLENFHVVLEHILEVRQSLPKGYYRQLPELSSGPLAGYPRAYEIATTLISHTDGRVDLENVGLFIRAFQEVRPLTIGELWAIPAMLRLALLESVRRMALRTVQGLDQEEEADRSATGLRTAGEETLPALEAAVRDFIAHPPRLTSVFVSRFLNRLRGARALRSGSAFLYSETGRDKWKAGGHAAAASGSGKKYAWSGV